jgi:uncharacterized membrane protein required for colicin V production
MKSLSKLLLIIIAFSVFFFGLRFYGQYIGYDIGTLVSDLGGLTYLYSTVGTIFAVFAAFVIISESQDWSRLSVASKDEVRDLNELFLWSKRLSKPLSEKCSQTIQQYLETVIDKEWKSLREGSESAETESIISTFHDLLILASKENLDIGAHMFTSFNELLSHRAIRIEYSCQPLPAILKFTVFLVDVAVIGLSLFIGVKNLWLDFMFMLCIVTLGSVILMVVDDLDNPLRPGEWCLTSNGHQRLLNNIRRS